MLGGKVIAGNLKSFHLLQNSPMGCLTVLALPVNGGKGRSEPAVKMSPNVSRFDSSPGTAGAQAAVHMACEPPPSDSKGKAESSSRNWPWHRVIPTSSQVVIETGDSVSAFAQREARSGGAL